MFYVPVKAADKVFFFHIFGDSQVYKFITEQLQPVNILVVSDCCLHTVSISSNEASVLLFICFALADA